MNTWLHDYIESHNSITEDVEDQNENHDPLLLRNYKELNQPTKALTPEVRLATLESTHHIYRCIVLNPSCTWTKTETWTQNKMDGGKF